ncbi:MAG TPA: hypothetical protein VFG77_04515, partial [Nitrososphaeraceae archaeon]|nr:hypothetical protein [Nitrososphaeraceae archaeon]
MNEGIILVGSAVAGSLLAIAIDKLVRPAFSKQNKNILASYDSVRTELNSLEFERNLVAESAIKVDEAFNEKRIDVYERDKLLQRYTTQIEQFEERIDKYQDLLDVADLRNQRDNLTEMINKRISSIDQKLKDIHNKFTVTYGSTEGDRIEQVMEKAVQEVVHNNLHDSKLIDDSKQLSTSTSPTLALTKISDDRPEVRQLEELHHQIMLELDRLEHVEKKVDET